MDSVKPFRFGKSRYAGKTSDEASASYRRSGVGRKVRLADGLERLRTEAPAGQKAQRPGPRSAGSDEHPSPPLLGIEGANRLLARIGADRAPLEICPDRRIPVAPRGERRRARTGKPLVVDETGALQCGDRVVARRRGDPSPLEPSAELCFGLVSGREGTRRYVDRLRAPELAAHDSQLRSAETPPHALT